MASTVTLPAELRQLWLSVFSPSLSLGARLPRSRILAHAAYARCYTLPPGPVPLVQDLPERWAAPEHAGQGRTVDYSLFETLDDSPSNVLLDRSRRRWPDCPQRGHTPLSAADRLTTRAVGLLATDPRAAGLIREDAMKQGHPLRPHLAFALHCASRLAADDPQGYLDWLPLVPASELSANPDAPFSVCDHARKLVAQWPDRVHVHTRFILILIASGFHHYAPLEGLLRHMVAIRPPSAIKTLTGQVETALETAQVADQVRQTFLWHWRSALVQQWAFNGKLDAALSVLDQPQTPRLKQSSYRMLADRLLSGTVELGADQPAQGRSRVEQLGRVLRAWKAVAPSRAAAWLSDGDGSLSALVPAALRSWRHGALPPEATTNSLSSFVSHLQSGRTRGLSATKLAGVIQTALQSGAPEPQVRAVLLGAQPSAPALVVYLHALMISARWMRGVDAALTIVALFQRHFSCTGVSPHLLQPHAASPPSPRLALLQPTRGIIDLLYVVLLDAAPTAEQGRTIYESFINCHFAKAGGLVVDGRLRPKDSAYAVFVRHVLHREGDIDAALAIILDAQSRDAQPPVAGLYELAHYCAAATPGQAVTAPQWPFSRCHSLAFAIIALLEHAGQRKQGAPSPKPRHLGWSAPFARQAPGTQTRAVDPAAFGRLQDVDWARARPLSPRHYKHLAWAFHDAGLEDQARTVWKWLDRRRGVASGPSFAEYERLRRERRRTTRLQLQDRAEDADRD